MPERLIDANELIKDGWILERHGQSNCVLSVMSIADVPTVDAVRVVHGRWYTADEDGYELAECSVCGGRSYDDLSDYPYCPMCGAKMDEEGEKDG